RLDPDLREKSYGDAEGRPQSWLDDRFVPPPESGDRMHHDEGIPGAEMIWDLAVRAYAAMERVEQSPSAHVVVVSHGGTSTFLVAAWIGIPLEAAGLVNFRFSPGGISVLRQDDYFHHHQVSELNDTRHIAAP